MKQEQFQKIQIMHYPANQGQKVFANISDKKKKKAQQC